MFESRSKNHKTLKLTAGEELHWVRCVICKTQWCASLNENADNICLQGDCVNSFEAKVIRATKAEEESFNDRFVCV